MSSMPEIRPKLKPVFTKFDLILESIAIGGLIVTCLLPVFAYFAQSETLQKYFPDEVSLIQNNALGFGVLASISIALYTGLTILGKFPQVFNYPHKVTAENALIQYTRGVRLLRILKSTLVMLLLFVGWQMWYVSENRQHGLWFISLIISLPIVLPVVLAFALTHKLPTTKN